MIAQLPVDTQMHGELVVYRRVVDRPGSDDVYELTPRQIGNGILTRLAQGGALAADEQVRFLAWDQIPLSAVKPKGKVETPHKERLGNLIRQLKRERDAQLALIPTRVVRSLAEALVHYRQHLAEGKEGTVLKHPDTIWKDGTSKD